MESLAISAAIVLIEMASSYVKQETGLKKRVNDGIEDIVVQLKRLQAYLEDARGIEGGEMLKNRVKEVRDIAYDIEDAVAIFMSKVQLYSPDHHHHTITIKAHKVYHYFGERSSLNEIFENIEGIKRKIDNLCTSYRIDPNGRVSFERQGPGSSSSTPKRNSSGNHETTFNILKTQKVFGFEKVKVRIMNQLINEKDHRRDTLVVVGPPGSGKSILMKHVYNDLRVVRNFDCYAWVRVTRSFQHEDIVSSMLKQFSPQTLHDSDVRVKLRNCLREKMYILVLDDIWRREDVDIIKAMLPGGLPGSKIIVTTRSKQDAGSNFHVRSPDHIHELNGLSSQHAWELFCKVTFKASKPCPPDLVEISRKILEKCEGLPLPIVEIGTLLSKKPQFPYEWNKFYESLASEIASTSNSTGGTSYFTTKLLPTFTDLSSNLKCCLLYLSLFPENFCFKRGRLLRSWVAEGFVKEQRGKTLEDVAEEYLNELIESNLVVSTALDFNGRPASCRVSNLVHQFIIMKSDDDSFVTVFSDGSSKSLHSKGRRLSVQGASEANLSSPGWNSVRTLLIFEKLSIIGRNIGDLKFLRVLHLQDPSLRNFPEEIFTCALLRYLSLRHTGIDSVPKTVEKLLYLETLDVKHTRVTMLPKEICKLHKLRHLLVCSYNTKNTNVTYERARGVELFAGIGNLSTIQKLPLIKASKHRGIIEELGKLTQLRKLGLVDLKTEGGKALCSSIQNMKYLSTLDVRGATKEDFIDLEGLQTSPPLSVQRLYLEGRLATLPNWIHKLHNLVRIGLRSSRLANTPLDLFQDLPHLTELNLVDAFVGEIMVFNAKKFRKLKILHIEELCNLHTMIIEKGALSGLNKLTLRSCEKLKILPLGIDGVYKLQELLLYSMPKELITSIKKNGMDGQNQMIRHVHVVHSYSVVDNKWAAHIINGPRL